MPPENSSIQPEVLTEDVFDSQSLVADAFNLQQQEKKKEENNKDKEDSSKFRHKVVIRVKIGDTVYSNLKGDFAERFILRKETRQYANSEFILKDSEKSIMSQALDSTNVEIEMGFAGFSKINVFVGKIFSVGRKMPDKTVIRAVDTSKELDTVSSGVVNSSSSPRGKVKEKDNTEDKKSKLQKLEEENSNLEEELEKAEANNDKEKKEEIESKIDDISEKIDTLRKEIDEKESKELTGDEEEGQTSSDRVEGKIKEQVDFSIVGVDLPRTGFSELVRQMDWVSSQLSKNQGSNNEFLSQFLGNARGTDGTGLKFAKDTNFSTGVKDSIFLQTGIMNAAKQKATEQGDEIVARANTIRQVAPGKEESSGLILSYKTNRDAFIGSPNFSKRSPLRKDSGYGATTVRSYSITDKENIGATVVSQPGIPKANGDIEVPEWGQVDLNSSIIDGSPYTWSTATRGGQRVPESQEVMENIARICDLLWKLTKKAGIEAVEVTSWYRDPATNNRVASSGLDGPHTTGHAVDFGYVGGNPSCVELFEELDANHDGGVAAHPNLFATNGRSGFIHLDLGGKRRWSY